MSIPLKTPATLPCRVEQTGKLPVSVSAFINEKIKLFAEGWLIIWLHQRILILEVTNGEAQYPGEGKAPGWERHLLRLRLFDKQKEWHIWKMNNDFYARYREENTSQPETKKWHFTDRELVLWGTQTNKSEKGFIRAWEERGTELILPEKLGQISQEDQNRRFVLTTRNYIDFNAIGQAGYVDSRFINIHLKEFRL